MENYKIINDEARFLEFVEWLPTPSKHERIYVALFARGKYDARFSTTCSDGEQLARFITDKERLFEKVKRLECELGSYHKNGHAVPNEALALYINPTPRDMKKANELLIQSSLALLSNRHDYWDLPQIALTAAHKSRGKAKIVGFDYDLPSPNLFEAQIELITQKVNPEALTLTRTRGGIHAFVIPQKVHKEFHITWHKELSALPYIDSQRIGDFETPAWGGVQGTFTPYQIKL